MGQIFGAIARHTNTDTTEAVFAMERDLNFWHPDVQNRYIDVHAAIGNRLLYNSPEACYEQLPLMCPQQRYVLSCIARLDNRDELALQLGYLTGDISRIPDGRFILDSFIKWKDTFTQHLIGDFAIAIWDRKERRLLLARDHMGIKPLFYVQTEDFFLFASDINAFRSLCRHQLNEDYLARMLARYVNNIPETCYQGVTRLMPAQSCVWQNDRLTAHVYWTLQPGTYPELKTEDDYYSHFRELLAEAVRCRLRTNGNIGCELSGGLDSSTITMLAARALQSEPDRLHTYSYVMPEAAKAFDDEWVDEEPEQEAVIGAANIPRQNVHKLTRAWFDNPVDEMDYATEVHGGISDTNCYWAEALRREAQKQNIRAMLSGFPGDELVSSSGGAWFFDLIARKAYAQVWSLVREQPVSRLKGIANYLVRKYIYHPAPADLVSQLRENNLLQPGYKRSRFLHAKILPFRPNHQQRLSERVTGPYTCLRMESEGLYALRNHMETRYPLADIRLLQFVLTIPAIFHKDAPQSRHVFRKATEGILPDKVRLRQNKKGSSLVFYRYKNHRALPILLSHYREPERLKHLIHTKKLHKIIYGKPADIERYLNAGVIRNTLWIIRFSEQKTTIS